MPKRQTNRLKHKITFVEITIIKDELLQEIESEVEYATVWADIKTMHGKEYFAAAAVQAERTSRFIIRYRDDIKTTMKINYNNRIFDIIEPPINDNEKNVTLTIIAKERIVNGN